MNEENFCPFRTVMRADGTVVVMLGNGLASKKEFDSHEKAQEYIDGKPWELLVVLACAVKGIEESKLKEE